MFYLRGAAGHIKQAPLNVEWVQVVQRFGTSGEKFEKCKGKHRQTDIDINIGIGMGMHIDLESICI